MRWADALFTARRDLAGSQAFYQQVHRRSAEAGRRAPLVLPGVFVYPGSTEQEAVDRKAELDERINYDTDLPLLAERLGLEPDRLQLDRELPYELLSDATSIAGAAGIVEQIITEAEHNGWTVRQIIANNGLGAHRVIVGAGEQIAEQLLSWVDDGASDGFVVSFGDYRHDFPVFAETTVPHLQRLGRFRTAYDAERTTLRQNLGL